MTGDEPRLAVLIMAAGESRRFGSCKLLADIDGKPMLQRSMELAIDQCFIHPNCDWAVASEIKQAQLQV